MHLKLIAVINIVLPVRAEWMNLRWLYGACRSGGFTFHRRFGLFCNSVYEKAETGRKELLRLRRLFRVLKGAGPLRIGRYGLEILLCRTSVCDVRFYLLRRNHLWEILFWAL